MSAITNSRARREPMTAPATTPALDGSSKASAEGDEGVGRRDGKMGEGKEKRKELMAGFF